MAKKHEVKIKDKKKNSPLIIPVLLEAAGNHFSMLVQELDMLRDYANVDAVKYAVAAEALIELAEVLDCGSIGGYGKGETEDDQQCLFNRWNWLCKKYWPDAMRCHDEGGGNAYFDYPELEEALLRGKNRIS